MGVKEQIKIALVKRNMTLTELHQKINKKYGKDDTLQNFSKKINNETMRYNEVEQIANILGFEIKWNDKAK